MNMLPLATFFGPEIFILVWSLLLLASLGLMIWSVIEIATKEFVSKNDKILWILIILFMGGIGSLIYLTQRKKLLAEKHPMDDFDRLDLDGRRPVREERIAKNYDDDQLV